MIRLPALQFRDFRLLWSGQLFSSVGTQMQLIAINWHVFLLRQGQTTSLTFNQWHINLNAQAVGLGTLGAVRIIPIILFAFLGGAVADHWDRRSIMPWAQFTGLPVCNTAWYPSPCQENINVALLYLFTALDAAIAAFHKPVQNAEPVTDETLPSAATLFSLLFQAGTVPGPLLAGTIIAILPRGTVYLGNDAACS